MNFFEQYDIYAKDNYAPANFHRWCSYMTLATSISRQIWLDIGIFRFFANLYVILVGSAGCGKSTAMNLAMNIIRQVGKVHISPTRQSKEDLITLMSRSSKEYTSPEGVPAMQTAFLIFAPELAQWLSIDAEGMTDVWTAIYDETGDFSCSTHKHGREIIREPYLNILAGVQPDKMSKYITEDILSTGFLRRTIFASPIERKERKLIFDISKEALEAAQNCVSIALKISEMVGPMTISPAAKQWFKEWFETRRISKAPLIAQFDENMHVQLVKLAMLTALGERQSMTVEISDFITPLKYLEDLKSTLPETLAGIARNSLKAVTDIFLSILDNNGGRMSQRELRMVMWQHCNSAEFSEIVSYLVGIGKIQVVFEKGGTVPFIERTNEKKETKDDSKTSTRPRLSDKLPYAGQNAPYPGREVSEGASGLLWE
jgi:energy-coupling factor transporter ATP-binding protein EcfA2